MTNHTRIALDAMGGDFGPAVVVAGAELARVRAPSVQFLLVGDRARIQPVLDKYPGLAAVSTIEHSDQKVEATDKPSQVLRHGRASSMGMAIEAVKQGRADAAVSAGNTGALMALAKFTLRTKEGIDRPALVSLMPTARSECVMLDLGANTECAASNLVEFAIMGAAFARTTLGLNRPSVALLNIGVEDMKGTEAIREAAASLRAGELDLDFVGFIEGDKIARGDVDVIVTDGFTGNVALKTAEGTAKFVGGLVRTAMTRSIWSRIGYLFARRGLQALRDHLDPNNHNGAVFLGLNGLVVKSHGGANESGMAAAISMAVELVADDITRRISDDMSRFSAERAAPATTDA